MSDQPKESKATQSFDSYYDAMSENYDDVMRMVNYSVPAWVKEQANQWMEKSVKVLDLACGNGWLADELIKAGVDPTLIGMDMSQGMLDQAKRKASYTKLIRANLNESIPFNENGYFDIVTSFGLLEFVANPIKVLLEIKRVLRSGGEAWTTFEARTENSPPQGSQVLSLDMRRYHYTEDDIRLMFEKVGLNIVSISSNISYVSPSTNSEVRYFFVKSLKGQNAKGT